jgi:hypothetical protein
MLISSQTAQCGLGTCVNIVAFSLNGFFLVMAHLLAQKYYVF